MTIFDMLEQSTVLTLLGMGVVFSFLVLMVITISFIGKVINLFVRKAQSGMSSACCTTNAGVQNAGNETSVTAAISAAVNEYRKNN